MRSYRGPLRRNSLDIKKTWKTGADICYLEILRFEAGFLCNSRQHSRSDFVFVMKCEHHVGPSLSLKYPMRTCRTFDSPPSTE